MKSVQESVKMFLVAYTLTENLKYNKSIKYVKRIIITYSMNFSAKWLVDLLFNQLSEVQLTGYISQICDKTNG